MPVNDRKREQFVTKRVDKIESAGFQFSR